MYDKELQIFSKTKKDYIFIILFILAGAIMIGHGLRMIYQGVFNQGSSYTPNYFDVFFDWLSLALLGFFILGFTIFWVYNKYKSTEIDKKTFIQENYQYPT